MRLPVVLLALAASLGCGDPARDSVVYPWPSKGGNCNRSGHSQQHSGPFDLSSPAWNFPTGSVVLTSPLIDADGNVYTTDTAGVVRALSRFGEVLWSYQMAKNPGVPTLYDGALYTCGGDGVAVALDMATGALRWRSRIGTTCPSDGWAAVASQGLVVMPADTLTYFDWEKGNCEFVAMNASDGRVRWAYNMCVSVGVRSFNFMPSIVAGKVIFHDQAGGVHCVTLDRGKLLWTSPAESPMTTSSGGLVVAPNGMVYCGFNYKGHADAGQGMVRAHNIHDGSVLWKRAFDHGVNVGLAVGLVHGHSDLAVVVAVGDNFMPALPLWKMLVVQQPWIPRSLTLPLLLDYSFPAKLMAMAADTGFLIWTYNIGVKQGWAYPGTDHGCIAEAFGSPSIGGDGTVYINWSAGCALAIRDANIDGRIQGEDPSEVSFVCHGHGTNSQSSIGPGIFVLATCEGYVGYAT